VPESLNAAKRARIGVLAIFFGSGILMATLASRMWVIREYLDADAGRMGVLLLFTSFGSISAMPFTGSLAARFGTSPVIRVTVVIAVLGLAGAGVAAVEGSQMAFAASLFVTGLGGGSWDVAQNLAGTDVEHGIGRAVMPQFHAGFSLGTVFAALVGAGFSRLGLPLLAHVGLAVGLVLVLCLAGSVTLLRHGATGAAETESEPETLVAGGGDPAGPLPKPKRAKFGALAAWAEPRTIMIGLVVMGAALAEGSANDWLILGIGQDFAVQEAVGIVGLACFLTAMTTMRAFGTRLIDTKGRLFAQVLSCVLALAGLTTYALAPWVGLAIVGGTVWGLGAALGFPMGMSAAADNPLKAAVRTSVVSTIGYTAFLAGPPLLGMLADHIGYRHALLVVAGPVVLGLILAPALKPRQD
jgi:MFS family permease